MRKSIFYVLLSAAAACATLSAHAAPQAYMSDTALLDATDAQVRALDARVAIHPADYQHAAGSAEVNPCRGIVDPAAVHDRELGAVFTNVCRLLQGDQKAHNIGLLAAALLSQTLEHSTADQDLKDLPFTLVGELEKMRVTPLVAVQP